MVTVALKHPPLCLPPSTIGNLEMTARFLFEKSLLERTQISSPNIAFAYSLSAAAVIIGGMISQLENGKGAGRRLQKCGWTSQLFNEVIQTLSEEK